MASKWQYNIHVYKHFALVCLCLRAGLYVFVFVYQYSPVYDINREGRATLKINGKNNVLGMNYDPILEDLQGHSFTKVNECTES